MTAKEKTRNSYLLRTYGISLADYDTLFILQQGGCKICHKPPKPNKNLHVDHDHKTGEVRGLLCYYCNRRVVGRNNKESVKVLVAYILPEYKLVLNEDKKDNT